MKMRKTKYLLTMMMLMLLGIPATAQRTTDKLDRGLVAVKSGTSTFVSWRIQPDEYYGTTYTLYRNGSKIAEGLTASNYNDTQYSASNTYKVEAVKHTGNEMSGEVKPWANNYLEIKPKHPAVITSTLVPNDACCVDVDGDGIVEILQKFDNREEINNRFPVNGNNGEYTIMECLKLDGTVLWWVNCGPNMGDFQNNEQNIVGYDWDLDGKGEVIMRLCEGATVHMSDGSTYTVGSDGKNGTSWTNYRVPKGEGSTEWFTHYGNEYLYYCEGATGKPYQCIEYPCKRLEDNEWGSLSKGQYLVNGSLSTFEGRLNSAWGDGYGHRSNKFFFGAPYLDGRKPSIFLGRGIYTRHKFVALDVNPVTHELTERWRWMNNQKGSPWYGNGYHNYAIVDVDWDGRDEIVWGSMVIDDNGKGLSTTGFGHGDAQHHSDLDPYTWGQEGWFCLEDQPGNNFRDLTTSKLYHRNHSSRDDGRSIAGNFSNAYPGCEMSSAYESMIVSSVTHENLPVSTSVSGMSQNFRCYWDGDLCEETFNYRNGKNTEGSINKFGTGSIAILSGSLTNNDTKGTPNFMGDILGDWREEFIMRTADNNIRIYTTNIPTTWRNYSLWYDHQYRNGMVWEMCGYNQPPHTSYFLGELENITMAPPSFSMNGRTEVSNGGSISHSGKEVITCETNDMTVSVADGATPYIYIDNAPSWVQGSAPSEATAETYAIRYNYYTHTLKGGAFAGDMRLVKLGEGTLVLPAVTETYTGNTEVWNGKLSFNGTMQKSHVWLNRHTTLLSDGGNFAAGVEAYYNSTITPGGAGNRGTITISDLTLDFGAKLELDLYAENPASNDLLKLNSLTLNRQPDAFGQYGPEHKAPVFVVNAHCLSGKTMLEAGDYLVAEVATINGDISSVEVQGLNGAKGYLVNENGKLYLRVEGTRDPAKVEWSGAVDSNWDIANTTNFLNGGSADIFVTGDEVTFNDDAVNSKVTVGSNIMPSEVIFDNFTSNYTLEGNSVQGGVFTQKGAGTTTISNTNSFTNATIAGGNVLVTSLANASGVDLGALGDVNTPITLKKGGALQTTSTINTTQKFTIGEDGGGFNVTGNTLTLDAQLNGGKNPVFKRGSGTLAFSSSAVNNNFGVFTVEAGTVQCEADFGTGTTTFKDTLVLSNGTTLRHNNGTGSYNSDVTKVKINSGSANWYLDGRCNYLNTLYGAGTLKLYPQGDISRTMLQLKGDEFTGTVDMETNGSYTGLNGYDGYLLDLPNGTLNVGSGFTLTTQNVQDSKTTNIRVAKVTGAGTLAGSGNLYVGSDGDDYFTYSTPCSLKVYKQGTNEMRLTSGKVTAAMYVNGGSVRINSTSTLAHGAYTTQINSGGRIYGAHYLQNCYINNGGMLDVCSTTKSTGTSKIANLMTLYAGGNMNMYLRTSGSSTYSSKITAVTLNLRGNLNIKPITDIEGATQVFEPAIGQSFTLWEVTNLRTDESSLVITLPKLPAGMGWDTSELFAAKGVLKIVKCAIRGDVNNDGVVNGTDIQAVINFIVESQYDENADVNNDGLVNGTDIQEIINIIVNAE
jgi:autotransporter-associated beta strand protein